MIRLGIVLPVAETLPHEVSRRADQGYESVSLFLWETNPVVNLTDLLSRTRSAADERGVAISTLSIYGNPLRTDTVGETVRALWQTLTTEAARLGVPVVSGFAGRVPGEGVEPSLDAWKRFFGPLSDQAARTGTKLAFENCRLGDTWKTGKWNIAINPDAWDLMFTALDADNLGLEWEPCHQLESLADPHTQLEAWASRVYHVHGKDAQVDGAALAERGFYSKTKWHHSVLPGAGDSDWQRLMSILRRADYHGSVDIENPDPAEMDSEERRNRETNSLQHLKLIRRF